MRFGGMLRIKSGAFRDLGGIAPATPRMWPVAPGKRRFSGWANPTRVYSFPTFEKVLVAARFDQSGAPPPELTGAKTSVPGGPPKTSAGAQANGTDLGRNCLALVAPGISVEIR